LFSHDLKQKALDPKRWDDPDYWEDFLEDLDDHMKGGKIAMFVVGSRTNSGGAQRTKKRTKYPVVQAVRSRQTTLKDGTRSGKTKANRTVGEGG